MRVADQMRDEVPPPAAMMAPTHCPREQETPMTTIPGGPPPEDTSRQHPYDDTRSAGRGPAEPRRRRWLLPTLTGIGGLILGAVLAASGSSANPDDTAAPTATTTVTAPAAAAVTKTVDKAVVPEECKQALAHADDVMEIDNEAFDVAATAMKAAGTLDYETVNEQAAKIRALTPQKNRAAVAYAAAKEKCQG
jgi:hypothetical protein